MRQRKFLKKIMTWMTLVGMGGVSFQLSGCDASIRTTVLGGLNGAAEDAWNKVPPEHKAMNKIRRYVFDPERIGFSLCSVTDSEAEVSINPSCCIVLDAGRSDAQKNSQRTAGGDEK